MSTLTLKKPNMEKAIDLSQAVGMRFVDRKGRYILQARLPITFINPDAYPAKQMSWVDIPLCPESYEE